MYKAFDAVFQVEVDADVIAKTSYNMLGARFRYQCLCCGEEVYLAAADSTIKAPHFRHRRGNNATDCEKYLGLPGAIEHYVSMRKYNKEYLGFSFNIEYMTFEISLRFTAEELDRYAMSSSRLSLYTKYCSQPFFTVPINRSNFIPDDVNYFLIKEYSNDYYSSIDDSSTKKVHKDIIKKDGKLNIYRIKQLDCHCKQNTSNILYTNENYLAISENKDNIRKLLDLQSIKILDDTFSFITQDRNFYAVKFVIKFVDHLARIYFQNHEFEVKTAETMDILWPPVFTRNSVAISKTDKVYIKSSFELIPHGNVEANGVHIRKLCGDVCEVEFSDGVTICEKNITSRIIKEDHVSKECIYEEPQITYTNKYYVQDTYDYYLFDQNGCSKLSTGLNVYLSSIDRIVGYKNGHIKSIILPKPAEEQDKKQMIDEIIKYHPKSELFEPDDFMDIEADETVLSYLESCYRSGTINSVIKTYIKEKLI